RKQAEREYEIRDIDPARIRSSFDGLRRWWLGHGFELVDPGSRRAAAPASGQWILVVRIEGDGRRARDPPSLQCWIGQNRVDACAAAADVRHHEVDVGGDVPGAAIGPPCVRR